MKFTVSHTVLLDLIKVELNELDYTRFEQNLVMTMHRAKPIWNPGIRSSTEFLETLSALIVSDERFSPTLKKLTTSLTSSSPSKPKVKAKLADILPAKVTPVTKSVAVANPSRKTLRKLRTELASTECKYSCSLRQCEDCKYIREHVAVTRCTHPKPHKLGWFVHCPRKVSRKFHNTKDIKQLESVIGSQNPFCAVPSEKTESAPIDSNEDRDVSIVEFPLVSEQSSSSSRNKRKRNRRVSNAPSHGWPCEDPPRFVSPPPPLTPEPRSPDYEDECDIPFSECTPEQRAAKCLRYFGTEDVP